MFDLEAFIVEQRDFSRKTFGPGDRLYGVLAHIRQELDEIEWKPDDISEWIDVILLTLDGAWRQGFNATEICDALRAKFEKNKARTWPPINDGTKPMNHVRSGAFNED